MPHKGRKPYICFTFLQVLLLLAFARDLFGKSLGKLIFSSAHKYSKLKLFSVGFVWDSARDVFEIIVIQFFKLLVHAYFSIFRLSKNFVQPAQ